METTPARVLELADRFDYNRKAYRSGHFNETQVRHEFIDPLFECLGWDVNNREGYAEAYKDVVHEDAIKIGGATKAPDYCFRVGGTRKFFVEAKKPSLDLHDDPAPAFQLRRYAWSAKLPLSILTDFEEFAVYDCRVKPDKSDRSATARTFYLHYHEYANRWAEIAAIFSRDAILKGAFDQYAESAAAKRGTSEVDAVFLREIELWRETLAQTAALRNPALTPREINFAVQTTLDRIIFLRMAEDRGIEEYGRLLAQQNGPHIYERLCHIFRLADERYNSGLFHFTVERGEPEAPDRLTLSLKMDDKPLRAIIKSLYYPESPYEFSVLPADILGHVYEQFLGKVIRLTARHQAVVEEKPEVRKAGGVYYTPTYIVDYIVRETVGKLVGGKKPGARGGVSKLRIVDPACGSGSFLIAVYQYLLDWHRDQYVAAGPGKHVRELYQGPGGEWRLTIDERKRILLNNVYGVDIDPQAVEVTKLSLLLKVLEGESVHTLNTQLKLFQERALPDLGNNIRCGNSLIGPEFHHNLQMGLLTNDDWYRINAFDWKAQFAEIFEAEGGFDAVVGNPPYIRLQTMKEWAPLEVEYYKKCYASAGKGNFDIYVAFVERSLQLLNDRGRLSFILPHKFFNAQYGRPLRGLIAEEHYLENVVHFGDEQVFPGATTYTCLLFLNKAGSSRAQVARVDDLAAWRAAGQCTEGSVVADRIGASEWNFVVGSSSSLFQRLDEMPIKLRDIAEEIFQGLITGADSVFVLQDSGDGTYHSEATGRSYRLEPALMHPICKGSRDIRRYHTTHLTKAILFPYLVVSGKPHLMSPNDLEERFPIAWQYLSENRAQLEAREHGKWRNVSWYGFGRSQNLAKMEFRKILTPSIAKMASFTFDDTGKYFFLGSGGGGGGGYGITLKTGCFHDYRYVLGLLNSKLLDTFLRHVSSAFSNGYFAYNRQYIEQLPIRTINFSEAKDIVHHDRMVRLVTAMLDLHKRHAESQVGHDRGIIESQIEATNHLIDQLAYELFDLDEADVRVIEADI